MKTTQNPGINAEGKINGMQKGIERLQDVRQPAGGGRHSIVHSPIPFRKLGITLRNSGDCSNSSGKGPHPVGMGSVGRRRPRQKKSRGVKRWGIKNLWNTYLSRKAWGRKKPVDKRTRNREKEFKGLLRWPICPTLKGKR